MQADQRGERPAVADLPVEVAAAFVAAACRRGAAELQGGVAQASGDPRLTARVGLLQFSVPTECPPALRASSLNGIAKKSTAVKLATPGWGTDGQPLAAWSSAGYLRAATGPFAGVFHAIAASPWLATIDVITAASLAAAGCGFESGRENLTPSIGNSGSGLPAQYAARDQMLAYMGGEPPDLVLHAGDIAYP